MQFIIYLLASLSSILGLIIGILLVRIAPEEQKPLGKHFLWFRKILLLLIFLVVIPYSYANLPYLAALIISFMLLIFFEFRLDLVKKSILDYGAFSILYFFSSQNLNLFAIETSLILLYGMPTASLLFKRKSEDKYKILFCAFPFIVIANLLFLAYHFSFLNFK